MEEFQVLEYILWFNPDQGWEIDGAYNKGEPIKLNRDMDSSEIIDALKEYEDILRPHDSEGTIQINGDYDQTLYVIRKMENYPICELVRIV